MNKETYYKVHATPENAFVRVFQKASFLNCAPLRSFFEECMVAGRRNYVVDFQECSSMDSTFLGILVGLAMKLRKFEDGRCLTLINLRGRNLETVQNLGIHKISDVNPNDPPPDDHKLNDLKRHEVRGSVGPETICQAHKTLMELNEKNAKMFCDVVNFLEQQKEDSA
jgi:anti-sigma B factor antagonist